MWPSHRFTDGGQPKNSTSAWLKETLKNNHALQSNISIASLRLKQNDHHSGLKWRLSYDVSDKITLFIDLFVKILKSKSPKPLTQFHTTQQVKKNHSFRNYCLSNPAERQKSFSISSHVLALASNSCLSVYLQHIKYKRRQWRESSKLTNK